MNQSDQTTKTATEATAMEKPNPVLFCFLNSFNAFSEPSSIDGDDGDSKSDSSNSSDLNSKNILHSNNRRSLQFSFAPTPLLPLTSRQPRSTVGTPPLRLTLLQRRQRQRASYYGQGHPLINQIQTHMRSHSQYHIISPCHTKSRSMQFAGKLEDILSSTMLHSPMNGEEKTHGDVSTDNLMENAETDSIASMDSNESSSSDAQANNVSDVTKQGQAKVTEEQQQAAGNDCCSAEYVYTAPCEHHPSKGQTDYLVNDMFPKLEASSSPIVFLFYSFCFVLLFQYSVICCCYLSLS